MDTVVVGVPSLLEVVVVDLDNALEKGRDIEEEEEDKGKHTWGGSLIFS